MAKPSKPSEIDYLSKVSLDITEADLRNAGVVKKFLQEHKELKAEALALKDSLRAAQDELENTRTSNHELDKTNAVLRTESSNGRKIGVIRDLSTVGLGGGLGYIANGNYHIGVTIVAISLLVYLLTKYTPNK